jgi:hypothetical protein
MSDNPEEPSSSTRKETPADKAVFSLCELLALLFGLPFGEDLYNDRPIPFWHYFYLVIAILFAVGGPMWPFKNVGLDPRERLKVAFERRSRCACLARRSTYPICLWDRS